MPSTTNPFLDVIEEEEEEVFPCPDCGSEWNHEDEANECCEAAYSCDHCGSGYRYQYEADDCCPTYECQSCWTVHRYEDEADSCCQPSADSLPDLPVIAPYDMVVPTMSNRPARLCSLEQELSHGGATVASMLYEHGLSRYSDIHGYHASSSRAGEIHVESDSSLPYGGGEVVYDRFDLSDPEDADRIGTALTKIRQLRDSRSTDRLVRTGFDAGIHVHVSCKDTDGRCLTPTQMAALHEVWSHYEDLLYSLSASGWNRHRQPRGGGGFCKAVPKVVGSTTPAKVYRAMRSDRYFGLNFQRLFSASTNCSCGAGNVGDWNDCNCGAMDRATVEFRVFNTSTLPRTIKAFMLISLAMVAYATTHEIGTLAVNEYGSATVAEKRHLLEDLLERLPLLEEEVELIREVASRAPGL